MHQVVHDTEVRAFDQFLEPLCTGIRKTCLNLNLDEANMGDKD